MKQAALDRGEPRRASTGSRRRCSSTSPRSIDETKQRRGSYGRRSPQSPDAIADRIAAAGLDLDLAIVDERRPDRPEQRGLRHVHADRRRDRRRRAPRLRAVLGAFDSRVHDTDDVARLGLPVLGHVPGFAGDHVGSLSARGASRRSCTIVDAMAISPITPRDKLQRLVDLGRKTLRYWWLVAVFAVVGGALSLAFALFKAKNYQSWATLFYQERIQIEPDVAEPRGGRAAQHRRPVPRAAARARAARADRQRSEAQPVPRRGRSRGRDRQAAPGGQVRGPRRATRSASCSPTRIPIARRRSPRS